MNENEERKIDALISSLDRAYGSIWRLMLRGLVLGLATGLGATIGVALVLSIASYILYSLSGLPTIGDWFDHINDRFLGN